MGALGFPPGFEAADPRTLADLGIGKTVTLTSTYDHRIIQGAESGLFLAYVSECLMGDHGFYDEVFESLDIPYEPVRWEKDVNASDDEGDGHLRLIKQVHVQTLINMYRVRGHLIAHLDPLDAEPPELHPELDPLHYGLTIWDLPRHFVADGLAGKDVATLDEILHTLRDAYCRTLGIEYMHIQDPEQKQWIQQHVEGVSTVLAARGAAPHPGPAQRRRGVRAVPALALRGPEAVRPGRGRVGHRPARHHPRRGGRGGPPRGGDGHGPPWTPQRAGQHRGQVLRRDLRGVRGEPRSRVGAGLGRREVPQGSGGHLRRPQRRLHPHHHGLQPLPPGGGRPGGGGHGPGQAGRSGRRARIRTRAGGRAPAIPSRCCPSCSTATPPSPARAWSPRPSTCRASAGYRTGGTVHIVINNQLGFTTAPEAARTSVYPTDVAKMVQAPIFHVNGDDPEACARAARLAFGFRQAFHKDVVIDMVCYRRHGHNEGDDPSYTQPLMYALIEAKRSVRKLYTESLVRRGDISLEEAEKALDDFSARLQAALDETRAEAEAEAAVPSAPRCFPPTWCPTSGSPRSRPVSRVRCSTRLAEVVRHGPRRVRHPSEAGPPVRAAGQDGRRR